MKTKVLFQLVSLLIFGNTLLFAQTHDEKLLKLTLSEECKAILYKKGKFYDAFIKIEFAEDNDFREFIKNHKDIKLHWSIRNKPDEEVIHTDSLQLNESNFHLDEDYFDCKFPFPIPEKYISQFIIFRLVNNKTKQSYKIYKRIINVDEITFPFLVFKGNSQFPMLEQFCKINDTLRFLTNLNDSISVQHISQTDSIALPPMYIENDNPYLKEQTLNSFNISCNDYFIPSQTGLYILKHPKNNYEFSVVVHNTKFPIFTKAIELVNVLHYILTDEERSLLLNAENTKSALDNFLVNLTGDNNLAKNFVKSYFRRAIEANEIFTNNKEGWKSDKGMIYIIFGKPDRVYFENGHEDWAYEKNALYNELNFYFQKTDSPEGFVFELERMKDYKEIWNSIIGKWRRGLIK